MANFNKVINKFREESFSERDKGFRFERLMQAYLKTTTMYASRFQEVWLWNDFPYRSQFGWQDIGIDLVAYTHEGEYWAIQCKCYNADTYINKPEVDSFISTSGRTFKNDEGVTVSFSERLWISTTNKWNSTAELTIQNQALPFTRLNLIDLETDEVDWEKLESGLFGEASRTKQFDIMEHQQKAIDKTHEYLKNHDRGKLIMACGTGKTFTSLKIAENETENNGLVLFLVPSIALLGQTLRSWCQQASLPIHPICICSDSQVTKAEEKEDEITTNVVDLALPASTDVNNIVQQLDYLNRVDKKGMTVVFSTYQSIDVISIAQKELLSRTNGTYGTFDLIICDEAHRTTGVTLKNSKESAFVRVHDNEYIRGKKRIYMTATPRLYTDDIKRKAEDNDAILCSMDDTNYYGDEIYRIGFGEAVEKGLLTDYKVLILAVGDKDITPALRKSITSEDGSIKTEDAPKFVGCINALSKKVLGDEGLIKATDPLHSLDYRSTFEADLKKMLPRLPLVESKEEFFAFSNAGRQLAELHLNYETIEPYRKCEIEFAPFTNKGDSMNYRVEKMRFGKIDSKTADKSVIYYNTSIAIKNIPSEAYEYVVNGKSAIEWIMERYQVTTDTKSGITNDPNDWAKEHDDEKYIYNLLLRIINVSVQTVEIVKSLPKLKFE